MRIIVSVVAFLCCSVPAIAQAVVEWQPGSDAVVVREALVLERLSRGGRSLIVTDPVELRLVRGTWAPPIAGEVVEAADGRTATWRQIESNDDGVFNDRALSGGYAFVRVRASQRAVVMLHARGHRHLIVNGRRRGGDVYNLGITALPIELHEGENELLFRGGRGRLRVELRKPESDLMWLDADHTLPHVIAGEEAPLLLAAPVANATTDQLLGVRGESESEDGMQTRELTLGIGGIAPLGVRKIGVMPLPDSNGGDDGMMVRTRAVANGSERVETGLREFKLDRRAPSQKHSRTFVSNIDGSVQYYAVTPPTDGARPEALILTLHGASVEARRQANAYGHKDWAIVVAPTNRRPFGFDWEDWGRLDAVEVLEEASARFGHTNEERTFLTGHSMGGHGTWQIGAHFAPRFAAIGPSAGWRDFWSYGGAGEFDQADPIGQILNTANNASRTLLLEENYRDLGVYVLHGDADNNVPVSQARFMRERLGAFHPDFAYYERPEAGHWWGNQCVDWPPMMRFFEDRSIDLAPESESFTTINPAISSEARLFAIHRQGKAMMPTKVEVVCATTDSPAQVTTENVLALTLMPAAFAEQSPRTVAIDGQVLSLDDATATSFERSSLEAPWRVVSVFEPALKGAHRAGPFKHAFRNNMAFVYATGGSEEENAWALAKARYDADTWQYRANGSVDVVPDTAFVPGSETNADRNIILYGCADSHRLWDELLGDAPVRIGRGFAEVGTQQVERGDVAAFFAYPRAGTDAALVGVVAGTGPIGRRLADESRYFISGVGYPDWLLMAPDVLETGLEGVIGAGFFGPDWSVDESQSAWR